MRLCSSLFNALVREKRKIEIGEDLLLISIFFSAFNINMTYTTNSVKVAKTGIQIAYSDDSGALSTQNISFDNKTMTLDSGLAIAGGNLSMTGDLSIEGGATFGGALNADGAATMSSTLDVTGALSAASTLAVAGDANLASALNVTGASHLIGDLTQDGAASFGSTVAVSGAASMASTLAVAGALTQDGAASFNSTVDISGASHLASTLLVDGASHLVGALTQDGAASFGSSVDVTGASHLKSTLLVDGASTMGSTLTVSGASTFNSNHTVNGTSAVNGAMTVSGATSVGGALSATGAATLGSTLNVAGAASFTSSATISGTSHLVGSVTADHALSVGTTLDVTGASHLKSTLLVDGASHLVGAVTADGAVSMGSTLDVAGNAHLNELYVDNDITVIGNSELQGYVSIGSNMTVTGASHLLSTLLVDSDTHLVGTLTQDGAASFGSSLTVSGDSHLTGAVSMDSTMDVTGASHLLSTLLVDSDTHLVGALTQDGAASFGSTLGVTGDVSMGAALAVTGAASLNSTLNVVDNATFQADVTVSGNLTVLGTQTSISTVSMEVKDNAILLSEGNVADAIETGIMVQYQPDGSDSAMYAGLKRRPNTGEFVFFKDATQQIAGVGGSSGPFLTEAVPKGLVFRINFVSPIYPHAVKIGYSGDGASSHYYLYASPQENGSDVHLVHIQNGGTDSPVLLNHISAYQGMMFQTFYIVFDKLGDVTGTIPLNQIQFYEDAEATYAIPSYFVTSAIFLGGLADVFTTSDTTTSISGTELFNANDGFYYLIVPNGTALSDGIFAVDQTTLAFTGTFNSGLQSRSLTNTPAMGGYTIKATYATAIRLTSLLLRPYDTNDPCPVDFHIYGAAEPTDGTVKMVHHQTTYMSDPVPTNLDYTNAYKTFYIVLNSLDPSTWFALGQIRFYEDDVVKTPDSAELLRGLGPFTLEVFDGDGNLVSTDVKTAMDLFTVDANYKFNNVSTLLYNNTDGSANGSIQVNEAWFIGSDDPSVLVDLTPLGAPNPPTAISAPSGGSGSSSEDIYATVLADGFTCASDARLKKDVAPLDNALEKLDHIRGVTYHWISEDQPQERQVGVIAQEIQSVYPELVHEGGNGFLSVDYPKLTAVLIAALKELKAEVDALKKQ